MAGPCLNLHKAGRVKIAFALLAIVLAAAILRLYALNSWPVFIDEDGYTWTSLEMLQKPLLEAIIWPSIVASKPPLALLMQGQLGRILGDPLLAGRAISAVAGIFTTFLCFLLGRRLSGNAVGLVAAALYALSPIAVLHERMVLQDGPMSTLALAAVLVGWSAIEGESLPLACAAAFLGALAVQIKVPAVAILVLPLLFTLVTRGNLAVKSRYAIVAAVGPVLSYTVLMVGPTGPGLRGQNSNLMREFSLAHPLALFWGNVGVLQDSVHAYLPAGLPFVILAGVALALWRTPRQALVYLAGILIWTVPFLVLSRFVPTRYFLPAVPFAFAFAAIALVRLPALADALGRGSGPRLALAAAATAVVLASGVGSLQLVTNFDSATMSQQDDWQYRSGWPAGYEYANARRYLDATMKPGSAVAYIVDPQHRVAIGFTSPLPPGVVSLGLFKPTDTLPNNYPGPLYVVVDDMRGTATGERLREVLSREPRLHILRHFSRIRSPKGVTILREIPSRE